MTSQSVYYWRRKRSRQGWSSFLLLLCLTSLITASSQYRSRPSSYLDESTFDSSYYTSEVTEEERILSALARIHGVDSKKSYHPKTRNISPSNIPTKKSPPPSSQRQKDAKKRRSNEALKDSSTSGGTSKKHINFQKRDFDKPDSRSEYLAEGRGAILSSEAQQGQNQELHNKSVERSVNPPTTDTTTAHENQTKDIPRTDLPLRSSTHSGNAAVAAPWSRPPQQRQLEIPAPISHQHHPPQKRLSTTRTTTQPTKPVVPAVSASVAASRREHPVTSNQQQQSEQSPTKVQSASSTPTTTPWIRKFLAARPKDVLLPVPREYISDGFNLAQLAPIVERIGFQSMGEDAVDIAKQLVQLPHAQQTSYPVYRLALELILSLNDEQENNNIRHHPLIPPHAIEEAAEALYLMVHARFVSSPRGLDALRRILKTSAVFGKCPQLSCRGTALLPHGFYDDYTTRKVSNKRINKDNKCLRYCPCCGEIWNFWESKTDSCAWGNSLCHLLLLTHGSEIYSKTMAVMTKSTSNAAITPSSSHLSQPAIMGFQIHPATTWGKPLSHQSTNA